jgi:hypothetical protein
VKASRTLLAALVPVTLVTVAVVLVPVFLIRPFSPQTSTHLVVAHHLRTLSPGLAPLGALAAAGLAFLWWKKDLRWPVRTLAVVSVALCGGAAWLSHQNHFEWMFAPLKSADYVRVREATFVDDADMVTAVELQGDAVAYPLRQMAYHHLVNDDVGGIPVVSTY